MADNNKLSKPGLIPLKVENQGSLITTQVNKINFTGSGVTASIGQFNDLTILITGGGGSGVSSSYALSSSFALTASYFSGSISNAISASYALSSSFALTASYFSGSISNAISSSYALTASYAFSASNAFSSSYAETASSALNARDILIYVKNQSGYNIAKGVVVRITGSGNSSDIPRVITASYEDDDNSANTLGITNEAIINGSEGFVMTEGVLLGINTNAYVSGQLIYLGATGSITGSAPKAPLHAVRLGEVVRHQSNNGSIYVRVDNGYELGELHDVLDNTTSSSYGDLLIKSGSVWTSSRLLTGSYEITGSLIVTSLTGSLTGSLIGTSSWAASSSHAVTASLAINATSASYALSSSFAITASFALNSRLLNGTASSVFATTGSNIFVGDQTITGSTNISGAFNLVGDINASSTTVVINSPSIALPGLAFPYTPSPTVNTVMFDASNNVLFITSSLPGGGGSGLVDRIQTGSITASVANGTGFTPHFFLLQSSSRELLKFNTEGVMALEAYYTTPTPITGGIYYSASGEFFFGI
jgi:hypothetical protein